MIIMRVDEFESNGLNTLYLFESQQEDFRILLRIRNSESKHIYEWFQTIQRKLLKIHPRIFVRAVTDHLVIGIKRAESHQALILLDYILTAIDGLKIDDEEKLVGIDEYPDNGLLAAVCNQVWSIKPDWAVFRSFDFSTGGSGKTVSDAFNIFFLFNGISPESVSPLLSGYIVTQDEDLSNPGETFVTNEAGTQFHQMAFGGRSTLVASKWVQTFEEDNALCSLIAGNYFFGAEGSQLFDELRDQRKLIYSMTSQSFFAFTGNLCYSHFSVEIGKEQLAVDAIRSLFMPTELPRYLTPVHDALNNFERWLALASNRGFLLDIFCNLIAKMHNPAGVAQQFRTLSESQVEAELETLASSFLYISVFQAPATGDLK